MELVIRGFKSLLEKSLIQKKIPTTVSESVPDPIGSIDT
jgi:hypothetical protein